jgi:hypothetical protein
MAAGDGLALLDGSLHRATIETRLLVGPAGPPSSFHQRDRLSRSSFSSSQRVPLTTASRTRTGDARTKRRSRRPSAAPSLERRDMSSFVASYSGTDLDAALLQLAVLRSFAAGRSTSPKDIIRRDLGSARGVLRPSGSNEFGHENRLPIRSGGVSDVASSHKNRIPATCDSAGGWVPFRREHVRRCRRDSVTLARRRRSCRCHPVGRR